MQRFRFAQALTAPASEYEGFEKGRDGQMWNWVDGMRGVLRLLFLLVENASRRFSYRCVAAATAVETVREPTLTG